MNEEGRSRSIARADCIEAETDKFWVGFFVGGLVVALAVLIFAIILP